MSRSRRTPEGAVPSGAPRPSGSTLAVAAGLVALVLAVFGRTLGDGWLNFDDDAYVTENPLVRGGLSAAGVAAAFRTVHTFTWHPLTTVSHMLDVELFGLDPWGHHLGNVLLHAATAVATFLVLRSLTGAFWRSALVALLFAVHPLRVESVAWISERKDVLSGLLFVLTLGAWGRYARARAPGAPGAPPPVGRYALALACFALALLAKPMVVTLPFVLLLLDAWPLGRLGQPGRPLAHAGALVVEKLPFLALAGAVVAITLSTQEGAMTAAETLTLGQRLANAVVAYAVYARQLVLPTGLALVYPHPRGGLPAWEVGLAGLVLAAVTALAFVQRRRRPFLLVGWLWFVGMLVPVIGLVQVGVQAHADRYTYLPHLGLLVMVVWGAGSAWPALERDRRLAAAVAAPAALALAALAWTQAGRWETSESIWRHTLACTSGNPVAHAQLGVALAADGRVDEAVAHYRAAIELQPDYATPRYNLGTVLADRGDLDGAIEQFLLAIEGRPDYAKAHNNLGAALGARGRTDEALVALRCAVALEPGYVEARVNLASALAGVGRTGEAIDAYREALRLDEASAKAHAGLGIALGSLGRVSEAIPHFRRAAELQPGSTTAHANLAMALDQEGDHAAARPHYLRAAELAEARGETVLATQMRARAR